MIFRDKYPWSVTFGFISPVWFFILIGRRAFKASGFEFLLGLAFCGFLKCWKKYLYVKKLTEEHQHTIFQWNLSFCLRPNARKHFYCRKHFVLLPFQEADVLSPSAGWFGNSKWLFYSHTEIICYSVHIILYEIYQSCFQ